MKKYIYEKIDEEVKKRLKNLNEGDLTFTYEGDSEDLLNEENYYFTKEFIPKVIESLEAEGNLQPKELTAKDFGEYVNSEVDFFLKLHY